MVRQIEGFSAERRLNLATKWRPAPLRPHAASLFTRTVVPAATYATAPNRPPGGRGSAGLAKGLLYLVILLGSSWLGYGSGALAWTLIIFAAPRIPGAAQWRITPKALPWRFETMHPRVRELLSSGYDEVEAVQRFAGKGLAGLIQKPYAAPALAEKVGEAFANA